MAAGASTSARERTWLGQPPGLAILFLTEMWEKFSFFGMQVLQVYYMTKALHFDQARASLVYGSYAAGVYLTPIAGGMISDRWLGKRRAVIVGGLLMALGHFMMASEALFFPAMVVLACGNGLFLPTLPRQVKPLYAAGVHPLLQGQQPRRLPRAAGVRHAGRAVRLALGLRRGGRGHVPGPGHLRGRLAPP